MKTTPGGRENNRNWRFGPVGTLFGVAMTLALVLAALAGPGDSTALTPPPADKAEIIYSNGGRIISINADGTDRKVLTNKGKVRTPGKYDEIGDRFPSVSPNGTQVLFIRHIKSRLSDNRFLFRGTNMLLNLETGKVREVLPLRGKVTYRNLAWLPGTGKVLAQKFVNGKVRKSSVVSIGLDGRGERTIVRFRDYDGGLPQKNLNYEAARLAASPDGSKFLMTRMDSWSETGYALELVETETGKRQLIRDHAHSGAWSPDGSRFVFVKDRPHSKVCDPDFDCGPAGDLFLASADGSKIHSLTADTRDEDHPSWSPDGSRIVFSGTIGRPEQGDTAELFSIKANRNCLVGLTNGSPASIDPSFVPGSGSALDPGTCGLSERPVLAENHLNRRENKGFGRRLWLGPSSSQGLLTFDSDITLSNLSYSVYGDCGTYRARDCPPGAALVTLPVCTSVTDWGTRISELLKYGFKRRGVWMYELSFGKHNAAVVYSGPQTTIISDLTSAGSAGAKALSHADLMKLVDELRSEGRKIHRKLPALLIPRFEFRVARQVKRYVKRHGFAEAVQRFGGDPEGVQGYLHLRRNARRIGAGFINCPTSWTM